MLFGFYNLLGLSSKLNELLTHAHFILYESHDNFTFLKIMVKNSSLCHLPTTIYFTGVH